MKIILKLGLALIFVGLGVVAYQFVNTPDKAKNSQVDKKALDILAQQKNTLVGWVQNINLKEKTILIRRKKLKPFMPKRETIKITDSTQLKYQEKDIELKEFQRGWPVRITYWGDQVAKGSYLATTIEVVVKDKTKK